MMLAAGKTIQFDGIPLPMGGAKAAMAPISSSGMLSRVIFSRR